MSLADRAGRSRSAFARQFPELAEAIAAQSAQASLVLDGDIPVDIVVGDRRIYGGDARQRSRGQIDEFMVKPLRLIMESPSAAGLVSEICIGLMHAMERTLAEAGKLADATAKLAEQTLAPLTERVNLAVERFGKAI